MVSTKQVSNVKTTTTTTKRTTTKESQMNSGNLNKDEKAAAKPTLLVMSHGSVCFI